MRWTRPITTEAELRALIAEPNSKVKLKILGKLERHSQHMIALSPLVVLSSTDHAGERVVSVISRRGRITAEGDGRLRIDDPDGALAEQWRDARGASSGPRDASSGPRGASSGPRGAGGLFVVPGIDETLRVNGKVSPSAAGGAVLLEVEEAFLQCPKAFVRSKLWDPAGWRGADQEAADTTPAEALTAPMRSFLERSPFAFLCTQSADGRGDVSPRGDPAGSFVRCLDDRTLLLPDRTGNHLVDSLRNVLSSPRATLVSVIAGQPHVLQIEARARLIADEDALAPSAVGGKAPKIGVVLELERARFVRDVLGPVWDAGGLLDPKDFPTMGEMILDQVNPGGGTLNKIGSKIFDLGSSYHKRFKLY